METQKPFAPLNPLGDLTKHGIALAGLVIAGLVLGSEMAEASELELRYDNGISASHVVNSGINQFIDELEEKSDGEISATHYYGALQSVVEASAGLREGILDMGSIFPQYLPAEFPINNFITEVPGVAKTSAIMTGANTEFVLLHCESCLAEFVEQNQLPLIMFANPTYQLILGGDDEVHVSGDVAGMKLRSGGNYFRAWIEHFGGIAVSIPGAEIFEGLNSGIIDGTVGVLPDVTGFGIEELVKSVTMVDVGTFHNGVFFGIRHDLWKSMSEERRALVLDLAVKGQALSSVNTDKEVKRVIEEVLPRSNVTINEPDQDFLDAQDEFVEAQITNASTTARDTRGIEGAESLAREFVDITRKWTALVEEIDANDADQVAQLYLDEIYSKIDISDFGM
ncbi:hypothetical protein A3731_10125 [Roseovarius sp. HI0049]|nr:hypothetical protein A3731_10125 [Roseovarius sp. HI0049]